MSEDLNAKFLQAKDDVVKLSKAPENDVKLKLYAMFKQATEGDNTSEPPSNPFDFVSRAKYEAWAGLKGKTQQDAMREYVELINKLKG